MIMRWNSANGWGNWELIPDYETGEIAGGVWVATDGEQPGNVRARSIDIINNFAFTTRVTYFKVTLSLTKGNTDSSAAQAFAMANSVEVGWSRTFVTMPDGADQEWEITIDYPEVDNLYVQLRSDRDVNPPSFSFIGSASITEIEAHGFGIEPD